MNWRYLLGKNLNLAKHSILSSSIFPLTRYVPRGISWLYDAQRFSGTRDFTVIFDVGANIGQTAWGLVRYFKAADIYCFEPVSNPFSILHKSYSGCKNVHCINKALGDSVGRAIIELHRNSELNTLVPNQPRKQDLTGNTEEIILDTLDRFCNANSIKHIDILKMDVQGWELKVLKGGHKMLLENRVRFICSEVGFREADSDMQNFGEFNEFMEEQGYWLCGLYDGFAWGSKKQFLGFANALYINSNFSS